MASAECFPSSEATNEKRLSQPLHANTLLNALNESRKNPALCDGVVLLKNAEVPVQRNVLSAASPYFRLFYQYDQLATAHTPPHIDHLNSGTFEQILDYIYTSVIVLNVENIQDILQAADLLLMGDLKELCCDYLEQCITVSNAIGIKDFSESFSCPRIQHIATKYIDEHFGEVTYCEEFMQLPLEKVKNILKRNTLSVRTEDEIFDCIMRWVRNDVLIRKSDLHELLTSCVHMGLLDERYLQDYVMPDELIHECELESLVIKRRKDDSQEHQRGYTNMIVLTGGEGPCDHDPSMVEIKANVRCQAPHNSSEPKCGPWIELASMTSPRIGHGLAEAGGNLYVVGGRDNSGRILNTGEMYDPVLDTWTAIAPMAHARVGFGLVTIDDKIYAIGGSNDMSDPLVSVEEYNIYTNKWRSLPDMNLRRAWSAYAVANKKIYVIGGGIMGKLYEAVECFDPKSEMWASVAPMKERRFDARAIGRGDTVFVFGGLRRMECPSAISYGTGMKFCSTEAYSTQYKQWNSISKNTNMCSMTETTHIDSVALFGDEILLIGDIDIGNNYYNCVRAFHPETNMWRGVIQNRPPNQRGTQAAMIKVPNSVIYRHLWTQCKMTGADLKNNLHSPLGEVPPHQK